MSERSLIILKGAGAIAVAFLLALVLLAALSQVRVSLYISDIWRIEVAIFQGLLDSTRLSFDHLYYVHTLLLYGFALIGFAVVFYGLYRYAIWGLLRKVRYSTGVRLFWRRYSVFTGLTLVFFLLLAVAEIRAQAS
ncbi:MAG: hypothetical protein JST76_09755 [Bacteroidetes bacterium]|nr:hypothetical protein [Bacteroidota bacterium]